MTIQEYFNAAEKSHWNAARIGAAGKSGRDKCNHFSESNVSSLACYLPKQALGGVE